MPAVIFDLDGVLIDSEGLQHEAYGHVLRPYGITVSVDEYGREFIGNGRGPEWTIEHFGIAATPAQLRAAKAAVYARLLRERVALMPGALECLARLASTFPLAVATNSAESELSFVLDRFAMRRYFAVIVPREKYKAAKPAPDAFLTAARELGVAPAHCVVVEDAYKGVLAAYRAGCFCVAIPHAYTRNNDFSLASRIVASLDEVTIQLIHEVLGVP